MSLKSKINYAPDGGGAAHRVATCTGHPFVALALLPPTAHPHLHTHCPFLPKIHQKGSPDASSHPGASLTVALNSRHDTRAGCPCDEYSQHSIDCLTHIWTLERTRARLSTCEWINTVCFLRSACLGPGKIFTVSNPASFIYLLRMMNVPRVWFIVYVRAVTTGPPHHDL